MKRSSMVLTTMAFRALSIAGRRPSLKSVSLACTALVGSALWTEAGAQPTTANPQTLAARIAAAHTGETIRLASGAYGPLVLNGRKFSGAGLVIEPQPGAKPVFPEVDIGGSEGITVKDVEVDILTERIGINVNDSHRIALVGLKVHSPPDKPLNGMMLRNGSDLAVTDSDFSALETGVNVVDNDRVQILRNTFHEIQSDAIRGASSHVDVIGNRSTNFHPQPGDHPDFIQFWQDKAVGPSTGNRVMDNVYQRGDGVGVQGVFIEDNKDIVISGNALLGTMYNAISLSRVQGAVIEDNFIQSYPDMPAHIITRGMSSDVTVRNNTATTVVNYAEEGKPNPNYKEQGNKPIKTAKPGDATALQDWLAKRPPH